MNSGQTMLTMGAMVILSLTTLRINKTSLNSDISLDETKYYMLAESLGSSIIEEANSKAFDEATVDDAVNSIDPLTGTLGPESGEHYPDFDDCDDYNGYHVFINNIPSANFNLSCTVCYVNPTTPNVNAGTRTYNKKITVTVSSPLMRDTIKISSILSYWYFR